MSQKAIVDHYKETNKYSYRDIVMRFLPMAGATVSFAYALLFYVMYDYMLASQIVFGFGCLYLSCLLVFKYGFTGNGKHYLTLIFITEIAIYSLYFFPKDTYFHIYFLVGMPLIYMLFTRQQQLSRVIYSIVAVAMLFAVEIINNNLFNNPFVMSADHVIFMKNANLITSVLVLSVTIFLFANMMEEAEERALKKSMTDYLTGLYNRRHFFTLSERIISEHKENHHPLTIAFLDLDHFKSINDEHGHHSGDQVLILVANILNHNIHSQDIIARIGGEEFVVLFTNTSGQHGIAKAEVIRQAILATKIPFTTKSISTSIGITELHDHDDSINQLLKRADNALYEAKTNGRNCIKSEFYNAENETSVIHLADKIQSTKST